MWDKVPISLCISIKYDAFVDKAPYVQEVVKLAASGPLHLFENVINYIYSKCESDPTSIQAVMGQKVKKGADFAMEFY